MDTTRFIKLWGSLDIGDCMSTPDAERNGLYRHIYTFADGDEALYQEMLDMLGEVTHIIDVAGKKTAFAKIENRIISVQQDRDKGLLLYMDAHKNLVGELVTLFDMLKRYLGALK